MSRGRSITTDLPTPSGMKWEVASLPTTSAAGTTGTLVRGSPAELGGAARSAIPAIRQASVAVRISVDFAMLRSFAVTLTLVAVACRRSSRCHHRGDAEADDIDAVAPGFVVRDRVGLGVRAGIDQAAKRQREGPKLPGE